MKEEVVQVPNKPFLGVLANATMCAKKALETDDNILENLLSKSTILHCSFTVEALANTILSFVTLPKKITEKIEQWNTIDKLAFLVFVTSGEELDRGNKTIQVFVDFFKARNNYVHPKVSMDEHIKKEHNVFISKEKYNIIKIPKGPSSWTSEHSTKCIKLLVESIDDFLLNSLKIKTDKLKHIFLIPVKAPNGKFFLIRNKEWFNWLKEQDCQPIFYKNILKTLLETPTKKAGG